MQGQISERAGRFEVKSIDDKLAAVDLGSRTDREAFYLDISLTGVGQASHLRGIICPRNAETVIKSSERMVGVPVVWIEPAKIYRPVGPRGGSKNQRFAPSGR